MRICDIQKTQQLLGYTTCHLLPFIHGFTNCDTTSRLFGISKSAAMKKLATCTNTNPYLLDQGQVFCRESSTSDVIRAGKHISCFPLGWCWRRRLGFVALQEVPKQSHFQHIICASAHFAPNRSDRTLSQPSRVHAGPDMDVKQTQFGAFIMGLIRITR